MPKLKILAAMAAGVLPLAGASAPAAAATAHNSQAGAFGSTTNNCAPTPYFTAGGCVGSYIKHLGDDGALPPPGRYRYRRSPRSGY